MGPWSKPSNAKTLSVTTRPALGPAEWALIIGLAALVVLSAVAVWCSRYEIGGGAAFPSRLDRFTGQVIGCVPGQGCFELVPAGQPSLRTAALHRMQGAAAAPEAAGNAATSPSTAPAQPASRAAAAPAKP